MESSTLSAAELRDLFSLYEDGPSHLYDTLQNQQDHAEGKADGEGGEGSEGSEGEGGEGGDEVLSQLPRDYTDPPSAPLKPQVLLSPIAPQGHAPLSPPVANFSM